MNMKRCLWLVMGLALFLAGCLPKGGGEPGCPVCPKEAMPVDLETIDRGTHSGVRDARKLVIRDALTWGALWSEHTFGQVPPPPLPPVDFAREMVIAVFLGEKPTSGYAAEIVEIRLTAEGLLVRVKATIPPSGVPLLQVLTQPFHIVKVPRYDGPVAFEVFTVTGKELF